MAANTDSIQFIQKVGQIDTTLSIDPVTALGLSNDLLSLATTLGGHSWYIAKAHERIGASYYYLDDLDKSNTHYYKALLLFDSLGDLSGEALTLNNLGWNYRVQQKNDLAISSFLQSLEIYEQLKDWKHLQGVLNNLGTAYRREEGKEQEALKAYRESLRFNLETGNKTWMAYSYNNIGLIHLDLEAYDSAIFYFQKAKQINLIIEHQEEYCRNLLNLGLAFLRQNMPDSAEAYFSKAKEMLTTHDFPKTAYVYHDYQYELHVFKKDYEAALRHYMKKTEYEKKLQQQRSEELLTRQRLIYENSKKQQELEASQQRTIAQDRLAIILLLGSIIALLLFLYRQKSTWAAQNKKLNDELRKNVVELKNLYEENDRIKKNLEKLVREETEKVLRKNERLRKYAFINSHKIRAPLARILGLIHVLNLEGHSVKEHEAFRKLKVSSAELDQVIRDINSVLLDDEYSTE